MPEDDKLLGYLRRVTADLHHTRGRLREIEAAAHEPIAVVGMACRFPGGVTTPEELWHLVRDGADAITPFPDDRGWNTEDLYDSDPDAPGRTYVREGGFLHDAGDFDADFFGISPREAEAMDPQQRLLLEASWEAVERAGIDPTSLKGRTAGVFVGAVALDYGPRLDVADGLEGHLMTGTTTSVVSGRIAYTLGLQGPAVTVDTACSSSLVALHLAVRSLRQGECDLALTGGVTVMPTLGTFMGFSRQRGLATDGRCKPFSAAADGFGPAEGAGMLCLERLSDARRNGHRVLAVVRGTAVSQDGASSGLSAPSGPAQQRVIRAALADAGLHASDVDVVEAHGTGTRLGDPIEAGALLATYGQGRDPERPLWLGSVKSNIGHTQAAAGAAGIVKTVLALQNQELPRTLHADEPSPHVDWSDGTLRLLTRSAPWLRGERQRRAGVSSFGVSGTNAHVILEEAPADEKIPAGEIPADEETPAPGGAARTLPAVPWVLSAKSVAALRDQAGRLAAHAELNPAQSPADTGLTLATARTAFDHRAVLLTPERTDGTHLLSRYASGDEPVEIVSGMVHDGIGPVFVFPGQGSQWTGMTVELLDDSPVFARRMDECAAALAPHLDVPLLQALLDEAALERVEVVQPVLWAVMVSLAAVWESYGVRPAAIVGHSQGEIAAAVVAGALTLEDGARVVALRSRELTALSGRGGGMASVTAPEEDVRRVVDSHRGTLSVAAVNGPAHIVVSGDADALDELLAAYDADGVRARRIPVGYASHSAHVEEIRAGVENAASGVSPRPSDVPFYSTVTARKTDTATLDAGYWYRNLRSLVRFEDTVRVLLDAGFRHFVEISPHPVLTPGVERTAEDHGSEVSVVGTLRRGDAGESRMLRSLAEAHVAGTPVDWARVFDATGAQRVDLPTYAFQRRRHWLDSTPPVSAAGGGMEPAGHPLLDAGVPLPDCDGHLFTGRWSLRTHPWLADHTVVDRVIVPGTALVETVLRAGEAVDCDRLEELSIETPIVLPADGRPLRVQITVGGPEDDDGRRAVGVYVCDTEGVWARYARATLAATGDHPEPTGLESWPPADGARQIDTSEWYERLAGAGLTYGPAFRGLGTVWIRGEEIYAEVALPDEARRSADGFGLHPALLDAALHAWPARADDLTSVGLPFLWTGVSLYATGASSLRVRLTPVTGGGMSVLVADHAGRPVASAEALVTRPVRDIGATVGDRTAGGGTLHRVKWTPVPTPAADGAPVLAVVGPDDLGPGLSRTVSRHDDLATLAEQLADGRCPRPEYVLTGIAQDDPTARSEAEGDTAEEALAAAGQALAVVQSWLADEAFAGTGTRLVLVTRGAVAAGAGEGVPGLAAAPVWGLVRSAQLEHPGRFVLADLDHDPASLAALPSALATGEPQLALRRGEISVPRLGDVPDAPELPEGAWKLRTTPGDALDGLTPVPSTAATRPLGERDVRVEIRAAGVNFRDVLISLGTYPDAENALMGSEGAGVVVEIGSGVTDVAVGDRVMGLGGEWFGSFTVVDERVVVGVPSGWSFVEAASVPVAFVTAFYALVDVAGVRSGESVLVHAAAGGVGMAAVQLARWLGAEVCATASESKWSVVRGLGVSADRIASSRSAGFAEVFRSGVDVVVDSLAGELVDASLGLVRPGGRFVELGKADVRDPAEVAAAYEGVKYRAFDLAEAGPDRMGEMLREVLRLFEAGVLRHLPTGVRDVRRAGEAFGLMSRAGHVGKLVLSVPAVASSVSGGGGWVLVSGGSGVLGGVVARHLVGVWGVRRLVLLSRSGDVGGLVGELSGWGCEVRVVVCDVADRVALGGVVAGLPGGVSGVVHAAGVLDDVVVEGLSGERLGGVLAAKVRGGWNLHEVMAGSGGLFVLFSSAAGVLGAAGQANYAAGNAFLDGLAAFRRSRGLSGVSVAWGLWEERSVMTGGLERADLARMLRMGVLPMSSEEGLRLFDTAARSPESAVLAARLDARSLAAGDAAGHPMLRGLLRQPSAPRRRSLTAAAHGTGTGDRATELRDSLLRQQPDGRRATLLDMVRTQVTTVLGHADADAVAPDRAFKELGLDSLTAVDLRNRLSTATGLRLPATLAFDHPDCSALAGHLLAEILGAEHTAADPGPYGHEASGTYPDDDPIAIVGMACRYPGGVATPEDLWRLVDSGGDAIGPLPADRGWDLDALYDPDPDTPGRAYVREGGFLHDAGRFDAEFFGISPVEALATDPQQRLLLETGWEAVERAGIVPATLRGSRTGVFVGSHYQEYGPRLHQAGQGIEGHLITGTAGSVVSGRIAYVLGLEGPAVTVDTACSSSLVAVHMAVRALRAGECDLALAGGVAVMPGPGALMGFSRQRGLAPDGRCKPFADAADGTSLAEGVGVLLVERLSDARRHGHQVLALVRGTATNQDGASNGLSAPNGPSQQRVIRAALADARLTTSDIDAVEAHGTGTRLGDPIEAQAVLATYGADRAAGAVPVRLGSVKSNIGHTQAAAGAAGIIKMVHALHHGVLPRSLHLDKPSDHVDWTSGAVELLRDPVAWPATDRIRRAGVSSFGISGTNAHVIIEEAPRQELGPAADSPGDASEPAGTVPWVLSGRSPGALRSQARHLLAHLRQRPADAMPSPRDLAVALATRRSLFAHRAVVTGERHEELESGLQALAAGGPAPHLVTGGPPTGRTAVLFTGQGSQRPGMAGELHRTHPVFAAAFDTVCARFDTLLPDEPPLRDVVFDTGETAAHTLTGTLHAQCALFAVEVALYRLLASWGMRPGMVAGHSVGEITAAHVAGALTLADACTLVAARGRLMRDLPEGGSMVAVRLPESEVEPLLAGHAHEVGLAAVNGPDSVVLSGAEDAVAEIVTQLEERGVRTRRLTVSHAFHSPLMEPVLAPLRAELSDLACTVPEIPVMSHLTGRFLPMDRPVEPEHWVRHVREPVRFADGIAALAARGVTTFLEIGPDAVLSAVGQDSAPQAEFVPTLRADEGEAAAVTRAAGQLFARGADIDWTAALAVPNGVPRAVELPTYAFQRADYWLPSDGPSINGDPRCPAGRPGALLHAADDAALAAELGLGDAGSTNALLPILAAYRRRREEESRIDGWCHRVAWTAATVPPSAPAGTWLLPVSAEQASDPWVTGLVTALRAEGTNPVLVPVSSGDEAPAAQLRAAADDAGAVSGVLSLLPLAPGRHPAHDAVPMGAALTLALLRALEENGSRLPVWHATRSAAAVGAAERVLHPEQLGVQALGRVAVLESSGHWRGTVDLPGRIDGWTGSRLAAVLAYSAADGGDGSGEEYERDIAVRGAGLFARRIVQAPGITPAGTTPAGPSAPSRPPGGTVLVTDGGGPLARQIALHLARGGAERLLLVRHPDRQSPDATDGLRAELTTLGARADIVVRDLGDRAEAAALLDGIPATGPLTVVVPTVPSSDSGTLAQQTVTGLQEALRTDARAARNLHDLTRDRADPAFFVLLTTLTAAVGAPRQGGQALSDALLDALAVERRAAGLPVTRVARGPWAGAAEDTGARDDGLVPMSPDLALRALDRAVGAQETGLAVFDADWQRLATHVAATSAARPLARLFDGVPALHDAVRSAGTVREDSYAPHPDEYLRRLRALPAEERSGEMLRLVRTQVALVLGHDTDDVVAPDRSFVEMGFDSLTATRLRNRLGAATGLQISAATVLDCPTPDTLADHLLELCTGPRARPRPRLRPRKRD
ncbi:type I polyketide synthase [Streptomyces sp. NBC_01012]|uniref:type I polyketide synthase n=1 Tax=Streptomyces sp. NBC_01012 TaxID=2903717 RepID=UPI0038654715|nr:acyltransferase domain-containing protein [Streptomyces sp. NBC_01012]